MATILRFEDILSWQHARALNRELGILIESGRFKKNFRIIGQIEGSAGSIMDNIAEGFERSGNREFQQYLYIAKGSCGELRSQLYRAIDRGYINETEADHFFKFVFRISALIQALINSIAVSDKTGTKYKRPPNS